MDSGSAKYGSVAIHGVLVWHTEDDEGGSVFWWNTSMQLRWEFSHGELKCGLRTPPLVEMVEVAECPKFKLHEAVCFSIGVHRACKQLGKSIAEL